MEMPVTTLNRFLRMTEEEGVMDQYWYYHDALHNHRGK